MFVIAAFAASGLNPIRDLVITSAPVGVPTARNNEGVSTLEPGETSILKAMMPGRVVRLLVKTGETVRRGQSLLILEAMKMENDIQSPVDGLVDEIFVNAGDTIEAGGQLLHVREE